MNIISGPRSVPAYSSVVGQGKAHALLSAGCQIALMLEQGRAAGTANLRLIVTRFFIPATEDGAAMLGALMQHHRLIELTSRRQ